MALAAPAHPRAAAYTAKRPRWIPIVEHLSVSTFVILLAPLLSRITDEIDTWADAFLAAVAVPFAIFAADLLSGFVHWFCDTFFEEDTPVVGRLLIHSFREHHRDPAAMTRHGFIELIGNSCMALTPMLGLAIWLDYGLLADTFVVSVAITMTCANLFHRWAHLQNVPAGVDLLQRAGLILSPTHHAKHHRLEHNEAYCVTTGWANSLADPLHLFKFLERILTKLGLPQHSK
jgi:ubiquitin-conjugating enzyme E2 variant